ncbi:hypothetical protein GCK72_020690 [Caenorhabditis remanei]|uniref:Uncharacterized protein n=1 Tax=Caenorhabditis remanei TaxID=31234 RepID=A0A6A5GG63_CAERE|nr:hypothetical protein GCK72_020690 [Caenorhabditis remanei]KAF1754130.1 hypothetical protein GCK72_020690 [Caenorhabditis remanei]
MEYPPTAPARPLAYESLKSVLRHMPIGTRNELRDRCPGIRTVESVAPLRIENLEFHNGEIVIEHQKYKFVKSTCPINEDPHISKNRKDFVYDDVSKDGNMERWEDFMTSGDLLINDDFRSTPPRRVPQDPTVTSSYIKYIFEDLKTGYTFTKYLKDTRVRTCLKKIAVKMLGGTGSPILVNNLVCTIFGGVIFLPENLKLQVVKLDTIQIAALDAFARIMDPDFPLESLKFGMLAYSPQLQHYLTKKTKILIFGPSSPGTNALQTILPLESFGSDTRSPCNVLDASESIAHSSPNYSGSSRANEQATSSGQLPP